jgi:hypothetical protein
MTNASRRSTIYYVKRTREGILKVVDKAGAQIKGRQREVRHRADEGSWCLMRRYPPRPYSGRVQAQARGPTVGTTPRGARSSPMPIASAPERGPIGEGGDLRWAIYPGGVGGNRETRRTEDADTFSRPPRDFALYSLRIVPSLLDDSCSTTVAPP